jgi:hypothetical protein
VGKILKNRDTYFVRNLNRGVSRQELGLSLLEYWRLKLEMLLCPNRLEKPKSA